MRTIKTIAIIGAGNGGCAAAAHLTQRGRVNKAHMTTHHLGKRRLGVVARGDEGTAQAGAAQAGDDRERAQQHEQRQPVEVAVAGQVESQQHRTVQRARQGAAEQLGVEQHRRNSQCKGQRHDGDERSWEPQRGKADDR